MITIQDMGVVARCAEGVVDYVCMLIHRPTDSPADSLTDSPMQNNMLDDDQCDRSQTINVTKILTTAGLENHCFLLQEERISSM